MDFQFASAAGEVCSAGMPDSMSREFGREKYDVARIVHGESKAAIAVACESVNFMADCGSRF